MDFRERVGQVVKRWGRPALFGAVVIGVLVVLHVIYSFGGHSNTDANKPTTSSQPPISSTSPTTSSSSSTPTVSPSQVSKATLRLVRLAGTATNGISTAALASQSEQVAVAKKYGLPSEQQQLITSMRTTGKKLSQAWGYPSVASANANATFYVQPQKFRVDKVSASSAVISLYVYDHWVTAPGQENLRPGITIITMRRVSGTWYFASAAMPSSGQAPAGDTFAQADKWYQPYLRGFEDYV